ncbi:MAG: trehalase family glycosidase, partial [Cytophagaceae bacterium]
MIKKILILHIALFFSSLLCNAQQSPDKLFGQLFHDVQMEELFEDSKTFADCIPRAKPKEIVKAYKKIKNKPSFTLDSFIKTYFIVPEVREEVYKANPELSIKEHINKLWDVLERDPDTIQGSSLLALPHSYIVPGGRFREIYYWDSYFTMLGLEVAGRHDLIISMLDNFAHMIDTYGHIPNGNRSYYLSRSQPPYFCLMIELAAKNDPNLLIKYLPQLEKEYYFWMNGTNKIRKPGDAYRRVVKMQNGEVLNRYWDDSPTPRPESYREDIVLAKNSNRDHKEVYRNVRAAAESGWDFSSRWFDGKTIASTIITDLIPIDLNCLLYKMEVMLSEMHEAGGNKKKSNLFKSKAASRKQAMNKYLLDKNAGIYLDYNFKTNKTTGKLTLASVSPLYFNIADRETAGNTARLVRDSLFFVGGLT